MNTRAVVASGVIVALVAGIAGGLLALGLDGKGGATTTVDHHCPLRRFREQRRTEFDPVALFAGARDGVVTIEASFGPDDTTVGSGFVVDARRGLIVTASHVIATAGSGSAEEAGRRLHRAR